MIYVFLAHGFEEIEALTPVDVLRRAELDVRTVGVGSKTITGSHGITVHCDIMDREVDLRQAEMVVLTGGLSGTKNLERSQVVQKAIDYMSEKEQWLAAICAAPSVLGRKGVLNGKTVTAYPGYEDQLMGANYTGSEVEVDGKIITGKGAGTAMSFSLKLVECLLSKERADEVGSEMQWTEK